MKFLLEKYNTLWENCVFSYLIWSKFASQGRLFPLNKKPLLLQNVRSEPLYFWNIRARCCFLWILSLSLLTKLSPIQRKTEIMSVRVKWIFWLFTSLKRNRTIVCYICLSLIFIYHNLTIENCIKMEGTYITPSKVIK